MASVYGSKVNEPTVTRRNVLSVDGRASYAADLAKAWSSFGEAKSVLQKLESKSVSPSSKDSTRMHSSKPCTVHFKPQPETVRQQSSKFGQEDCDIDAGTRVHGILKGSKNREKGRDNVYVVEPPVLNEQEEDDKVQGSPKVLNSHKEELESSSPQLSSTQKYVVGPASSTSPHSNATAVFGPPVSFGSSSRGEQRSSAMKTSRLTQDRSFPKPTRTNPGLNDDDKAVPVSGPGPSTQSIHVLPHSAHLETKSHRTGERPNIRKFELPPEVVGTLSAKVELQKQALRDKSVSHRHKQPRRGMETNGHQPHTNYNPVTKKRKVASVPPPPTYSGFSSIRSSQSDSKAAPPPGPRATGTYKGGPIQWKPNVEKVGMPSSRTSFKPPVGTHAQLSKTVGDRVRKVHRMPTLDLNVQGTPVGSSKEPPGLITTSSWRAGKELTDKILREGKRQKSNDPQSILSSPPSSIHLPFDLSPNREPNLPQVSRTSDHSVTSPPHTGTHYTQAYTSGVKEAESRQTNDSPRKKFDDILVDLELSVEDGDSDKEGGPEERMLKRPLSGDPGVGTSKGNPGSRKPKHTYNEPTYPTERVRHYDQTEVQAYIQRQKDERRRKAQEKKQVTSTASSERQKKLRELYETQRKRVESNLRLKQRKREAYAKSLSAGIHIHLYDTASSTTTGSEALDAPVPTLMIHPAPTTHHRSSRSREPYVSSSQIRQSFSSGGTAPHIQPSPPHSSQPSHLHPSPPSHPPPSPHTSPNRLRVHGTNKTSHSTQKDQSPTRSVSPRTYTLRSSPTTSPGQRVTTATAHAQLSPRGYQTNPSPPPTGKLTALLRGSTQGPYAAVHSPPKTHEERLQAIKASALRLKERIAKESKKAFEDSYSETSFERHDRTRYPPDIPVSERHQTNEQGHTPTVEPARYRHQVNEQGRTPAELPGVHSMYEHALQTEQLRQQTEAAVKIQAAYRGHSIRKSLKWELPSGRTLNSIIKGANQLEKQAQSNQDERLYVVTSASSTLPAQQLPVYSSSLAESGILEPHHHHHPPSRPDPTPAVLEPWKQGGGDSHSVINVFTRQQERLRETLSLLSDQKREEIRNMAARENAKETSPVHVTVSLSFDLSSIEGEDNQEQTKHSSYSQVLESNSSFQDDGSVHSDSQLSAPFSRDSLFSQPSPQASPHPSSQLSPQPITTTVDKSPPSQGQAGYSPSSIASGVSVSSLEKEISAITPPGSPSFVESFSSHTGSHPPSVPPTVGYSHSGPPASGRLSPRSLELKHQAQLNLYETVEEHLRHVTHVERARDLSLAQQETVTLAEQFKTHEQAHKEDMDALASKAKKDIEVVQRHLEDESKNSSTRMRHLQEQVDLQMKEHSRRLAEMQEESAQAAREATHRLNEARSAATSAVIEAAQQQIQAAHTMAVSVAATATKEAVREAMKQDTVPLVEKEEQSVCEMEEPHYESDFDPSTMQPDSLVGSEVEADHSPREYTPPTETVDSEDGSTRDNTLTPSSLGDGAGDSTLVDEKREESSRSSSPQEVEEEDGSEISFRDVNQSEGHHHSIKSHLDQRNSFSESEEVGVACSASRSNTPSQDDRQSPFSPVGEDSFFLFTSRMVAEYVKQEELRASHQAALLHLREKALKEKTEVQLKWLQLKKRDLHSKGADDLMPPLKKKEKGLLREFKQEQAEIHRLKEAQEAARHERKLMLLDQKEISKIRNSTRYYREKIRSYRSRSHASPSPAPSVDDSIISHTHDYSRSMTPDYSIFSDISGADESQTTSATPSEHLEPSIPLGTSHTATFPTYSPSIPQDSFATSDHMDSSSRVDPTASVSEHIEGGSLPSGSFSSPSAASRKKSDSPLASKRREKSTTPKTPSSSSVTLKNLNKMASNEAERYLTKRKQSLLKRRQAAERAIQQHRDLLKKEQELDKEEESVNKLVVEAMEMLKQTSSTRVHSRHENLNFDLLASSHEPHVTPTQTQESPLNHTHSLSGQWSLSRSSKMPASVSEDLKTTSSIREEISLQNGAEPSHDRPGTVTTEVPSAYAVDTFESLDSTLTHTPHHHHPITTSTPEPRGQEYSEVDDLSLMDSVQVTGSVSESIATTTSGGSVLEERIRVLKEQLKQRKEEVKRIQNEQKRKKKAMLKQQEEKLKRKLEAVDQKAKRVVAPHPPPSHSLSPDTGTPSTLSVASEVEHHFSSPSREGSISPTHIEERRPQDSQLDSKDILVTTSANKESLSSRSIQEDLTVSYTPFTSNDSVSPHRQSDVIEEGKDETLTPPHSVRSKSPQLDAGGEDESVPEDITEDVESNVESVEPLVPPPGFDGRSDDSSTCLEGRPEYPPSHSDQQFEANPSQERAVSPNESLTKQLSGEVVANANILPDEMPPKGHSLPGDNSTLVEEEEQVRIDYSEDFEPEEPEENEYSPQPESSDLDSRSDSSLISDSKGGDSGDEINYHPGQRVLVGGVKEGIVRFVGHTQFASGVWIGVEIGEPRGKNDGSVDGERYFSCPPKQGLFAPPNKVSIIEDTEDAIDIENGSLQGSSVDEELESVHTEIDTEEEEGGGGENTHVEEAVEQYPPLDMGQHVEYTEDFEPSECEKSKSQFVDVGLKHQSYKQPPQDDKPVSTMDQSAEQIVQDKNTGQESEIIGSALAEQQAPAAVQSVGEKPDSLPKAPEVTLQRLQSATPTPAPPPEFAEGASREASTEPPPVPTEPPHVDRKQEKLSDELAQELMNEAYQTMHQIWKAKREVESVVPEEGRKITGVVQIPKDRDIPLGVDEKADRITEQLLLLLLKSETSLMSNIHTSKKIAEEPKTPPRHHPPLQLSLTGGVSIKESSPPPLSPPSPYRPTPAMLFPPGEHSPPGSPPCHLSQLSAARVAAGDRSPPLIKQELPPPSTSKLERSNSMESVVNLLDSIKLTTAQCMVPSERLHVNEVVESAWKVAQDIGFGPLHSMEVSCPSHVLNLFKDIRVLSPEEEHCHQAYVKLVFDLTLEIIRLSHPVQDRGVVWLHGCTVKAPLAPSHTNEGTPSIEVIQKRVYAALIRGQLPTQLPAVKFLHRMKRPGGKEVDFVDGILIKELRGEEPGWIDYHKDETTVKMKTADTILDTLLSEAVQIMCNIEQKRKQNGCVN